MPYTSDSWTFGHVPTTFKRLPTVNRWGVLHGFYSDQRDDQELSNSAPDMPSGVGFRILANRNIWRFPNSKGRLSYTAANDSRGQGYDGGSMYYAFASQNVKTMVSMQEENIPADPAIDLSRSNSLYQDGLNEVRVNALFGLNLIKAF